MKDRGVGNQTSLSLVIHEFPLAISFNNIGPLYFRDIVKENLISSTDS